MNSSIWGDHLWKSMFFIAYGYQFNKTARSIKDPQYVSFFKSIGNVMPCKACRESYNDFFTLLDIDKYIHAKHGLLKFVYNLKDMVNRKLISQKITEFQTIGTKKNLKDLENFINKKTSPPFEVVLAYYSNFIAK